MENERYVKLSDVLRVIDFEYDLECSRWEKADDRLSAVREGKEDPHGRTAEHLEKVAYKHDMKSEAIKRLKFRLLAELDA